MKTWTVRVTYGCAACARYWVLDPSGHEGCFSGLRGDPDRTVATYDSIEAPTIAAARRRGLLLYRLDNPTLPPRPNNSKWRRIAHATENKGEIHD